MEHTVFFDDMYGYADVKRQGLLSVAMAFLPVGRPYEFRSQAGSGELVIRLQNDWFCRLLAATVALVLILAGWLMRGAKARTKAILIVTLLSSAVGLSGLVPLSQVFWLDGLFLGALGIWMLYIAQWLGLWLAGLRWGRAASVAAVLVLSVSAVPGLADEAKPASSPANTAVSVKPAVPAFESDLPRIYIPYASW